MKKKVNTVANETAGEKQKLLKESEIKNKKLENIIVAK